MTDQEQSQRIGRLEKQFDAVDGKYETKESGEATHFKMRKMLEDMGDVRNDVTELKTDMDWVKKTMFGIIALLISLLSISVWDIFIR